MATVTVDETRGPRKSVTLTENDRDSAVAVMDAVNASTEFTINASQAARIVRALTGGNA